MRVAKPEQIILIIEGKFRRTNDVFLRYLRTANGNWKFAGERRAFVRNEIRKQEITSVFGKPFLKIASDRTQVGFSIRQEVEEWFDLTRSDLKPVFTFTREGSFSNFGLSV